MTIYAKPACSRAKPQSTAPPLHSLLRESQLANVLLKELETDRFFKAGLHFLLNKPRFRGRSPAFLRTNIPALLPNCSPTVWQEQAPSHERRGKKNFPLTP